MPQHRYKTVSKRPFFEDTPATVNKAVTISIDRQSEACAISCITCSVRKAAALDTASADVLCLRRSEKAY